eukprot:TRINITY_DN2254_c0_g6_i1.p1 TRINITY_DN2254_c0_g6~~TRINITY_DN2254_c0_g6_i1.p1  ORF type:complete len:455 (-),score=106.38 TRINITY_DN2254_c0_g6_i1:307-1671(-)
MDPSAWERASNEVSEPSQKPEKLSGTSISNAENDNSERKQLMPVDIKEYPSKYVFKVDVPGLRSHHIRVQVGENNVLTISGERKEDEEDNKDEENDVKFLQIERKFGKFSRTLNLPDFCKQDAISASCNDGVLAVTIPKLLPAEHNEGTTIQVQVTEKVNSGENNKGFINGVSVVEESLSNTSSPNLGYRKQNSLLNSKSKNAKERNGERRMEEAVASDAELEIVSSDFVTEAKDSKSELWPNSTVAVFIAKFEGVYNSVNHGYLAQKHWDQIAAETNKICNSNLTGLQCKYKWHRLRKIYKREKLKLNATGANISTWPFYADFDRILGRSRKIMKLTGGFEEMEWNHPDHPILSKRKECEALLYENASKEENQDSISRRRKELYSSKDNDGEGKRVKRVQSTMDSIAVAMETNMKSLTETMKEIEQNKMRQESMQLDKILQTQLQIARLFAQK